MPAVNFNAQFASLVERGEKTTTIRRKPPRGIEIGEKLSLYTGMRTKQCRLLGVGIVKRIERIRIDDVTVTFGKARLSGHGCLLMATRDGFHGVLDFYAWFRDHYGLPFEGVFVEWQMVGQAYEPMNKG